MSDPVQNRTEFLAEPVGSDLYRRLRQELRAAVSFRLDDTISVPTKLLREAHACMRACGWHQAAAAGEAPESDGVLEAAVVDVEARFAVVLGAAREG